VSLVLALLGGVTVDRLGLVAGLLGMGGGLALLWRRWPAEEALALLQGGAAMVGFGLGDIRGGGWFLRGWRSAASPSPWRARAGCGAGRSWRWPGCRPSGCSPAISASSARPRRSRRCWRGGSSR
ncbi:unnamed protein product, partial [Acidocella sp. C78]